MKRRYCKQRSSAERANWYGCIPNGIGEVKSDAHPASRGRKAELHEDRTENVGARSVGAPPNLWLCPSTGWQARFLLTEGIKRMGFRGSRRRPGGGTRQESRVVAAFWVGRQARVCRSASPRAIDGVTLGCLRKQAVRRSLGWTLPVALHSRWSGLPSVAGQASTVAVHGGQTRLPRRRHRRGRPQGGRAEPRRIVCAGYSVRQVGSRHGTGVRGQWSGDGGFTCSPCRLVTSSPPPTSASWPSATWRSFACRRHSARRRPRTWAISSLRALRWQRICILARWLCWSPRATPARPRSCGCRCWNEGLQNAECGM